MKNLRRIVTGHNEAGKSIIMIDGKPSRTIGEDVGGLFEIWNTDGKEIETSTYKVGSEVWMSTTANSSLCIQSWELSAAKM